MRARLEIFIGLGKASYPGVFGIGKIGLGSVSLPTETYQATAGKKKGAARWAPRVSQREGEKGAGELPNWAAADGPRWGKVSRPERGWAEGVRGVSAGFFFFKNLFCFLFPNIFQLEFCVQNKFS
jgi:hypothetical protein